jgi:hypothetical protein
MFRANILFIIIYENLNFKIKSDIYSKIHLIYMIENSIFARSKKAFFLE